MTTIAPYLAIIAGLCILVDVAVVSWLHERSRRIHAETLLAAAVAELAGGWDDDHGSADDWAMTPDVWRSLTARHHAEQVAQEQEECES